ncbi:MAG: DNA primase, partial [Pseudothermotoga sp.]
GPEALKNALKNAIPFENYLVDFYSKIFDLSSTSGSERFLAQMKVWVDSLLNTQRIQRYENLLKAISERVKLSVAQLTDYFRRGTFEKPDTGKMNLPNDEDYFIYLYITQQDLRKELERIDRTVMSEKTRRIIDLLESNSNIAEQDEEIRKYVFDLMSKIPPGDPLKMLEDIRKRFARKAIEKRLSQIDGKLANCKSDEERVQLLQERLRLIASIGRIGGDQGGK